MPADDEMTVADFRGLFVPRGEETEAPVEADTAAVEEDVELAEEAVEDEVVEEEAEAEADEETPGKKRGPDGRFAADEPELILGKYKTTDDAIKALEEAQRKLGEQGSELGELRQMREEMQALREELKPQPAQPQYDQDQLDTYFETNPHLVPQVAQRALDSGDGVLYQRAIAAWGQLDQVGAMDFHARAIANAQAETLRQEFAPLKAEAQKQSAAQEYQQAFATLAGEHEDFAQVMGSIPETGPPGFPVSILQNLMTGDQATKQDVLETLYRWTKAEQAGTLTQAATDAAERVAAESKAARQEAVVATSSSSPNTRDAKANVDVWREDFRNSPEFRKAAGLA